MRYLEEFNEALSRAANSGCELEDAASNTVPPDLLLADGTRIGDYVEAASLPPGKRFNDYTLADMQVWETAISAIARIYDERAKALKTVQEILRRHMTTREGGE
jgi:hypothetical protein